MAIKIYSELEQGSPEWLQARCGLLTASEMKLIITAKKLEYSSSEKERSHLYELAAQRVNNFVEPHYISDDMLRGKEDEIKARELYEEHYEFVDEVGFITNDKWGFTLGYSPDGLVGNNGLIECKSRRQKFQFQTFIEDEAPDEYMLQLQTGLLVSEREWIDFISYSAGMPMYVKRVFADEVMQSAIIQASKIFHEKLDAIVDKYKARVKEQGRIFIPTEREIEQEIVI